MNLKSTEEQKTEKKNQHKNRKTFKLSFPANVILNLIKSSSNACENEIIRWKFLYTKIPTWIKINRIEIFVLQNFSVHRQENAKFFFDIWDTIFNKMYSDVKFEIIIEVFIFFWWFLCVTVKMTSIFDLFSYKILQVRKKESENATIFKSLFAHFQRRKNLSSTLVVSSFSGTNSFENVKNSLENKGQSQWTFKFYKFFQTFKRKRVSNWGDFIAQWNNGLLV